MPFGDDYVTFRVAEKIFCCFTFPIGQVVQMKCSPDEFDEIAELFGRLSDEQKSSELGAEIALNLGLIQAEERDFAIAELADLEGNTYHFPHSFGKMILLNFWSSGRVPCIQSLPEMKEITEKYVNALKIVSINVD